MYGRAYSQRGMCPYWLLFSCETTKLMGGKFYSTLYYLLGNSNKITAKPRQACMGPVDVHAHYANVQLCVCDACALYCPLQKRSVKSRFHPCVEGFDEYLV